mgnify:CR=1 FL=1
MKPTRLPSTLTLGLGLNGTFTCVLPPSISACSSPTGPQPVSPLEITPLTASGSGYASQFLGSLPFFTFGPSSHQKSSPTEILP